MSTLLQHISTAALPVAIALLTATALARVALWMDDADTRRLARRYLDPLSVWCLIAVAVHTLALVGAGDAGGGALALALGLAAAAVWLPWTAGDPVAETHAASAEQAESAAPAPDPPGAEPEPPPRPARPLAPGESLWARPVAADRRSTDLW
jgi:hypothetical protein